MTDAFKQQIQAEARQAVEELLEQAKLKKGDVFVVGCSSSEIVGGHIGKDSSLVSGSGAYFQYSVSLMGFSQSSHKSHYVGLGYGLSQSYPKCAVLVGHVPYLFRNEKMSWNISHDPEHFRARYAPCLYLGSDHPLSSFCHQVHDRRSSQLLFLSLCYHKNNVFGI